MYKCVFLFCYLFVILFFGCSEKSDEMLLSEASEMMKVNLDSANIILESMLYPEHLSDSLQMRYNQIKISYVINRSKQWEQADSLNNLVASYYAQKKDTIQLKEALLISGWISLNLNRPDKAIVQFFNLKNLYEQQPDNCGMQSCFFYISQAYSDKNDHDSALFFAKKILDYLVEQDTVRNAHYFRFIASVHKKRNETDSAMHYYSKALDGYKCSANGDYMISNMLNNVSELLLNNNQYKEALQYADLSLHKRATRKDASFFNLTKAKVFVAINQTDSAKLYLRRAIESSDDDFVTIAAYNYLADLYQDTEDYAQAFFRQQNAYELFRGKMSGMNVELLTQKYQEEKFKNEKNELQLARREQEIFLLLIILISVVVIVALLFYMFAERKKKRVREHILREEALEVQSQNVENENKLLRQENELIVLREKSAILRESLFRKMSFATKIPSLKKSDDDRQTASRGKIHLEEPDWSELICTVDELFGGFASRLAKEYPDLSKEDVGFCCLIKINVSMQDLADIYCISKAGITKRKTRMKKDKLNISDESISLDVFLTSF